MKLTPREPSPKMLEAAFKTLVTKGLSYADVATGVWRAMHDAAPSVNQELLALLEDWVTSFGDRLEGGDDEIVKASRAAIARAKEE